jgi:hypothetical protein
MAEAISQPSAEQQQAAVGERVCGQDPLASLVGDPELALRGGQSHTYDGCIHTDHERGQRDDQERPAPASRRLQAFLRPGRASSSIEFHSRAPYR